MAKSEKLPWSKKVFPSKKIKLLCFGGARPSKDSYSALYMLDKYIGWETHYREDAQRNNKEKRKEEGP